MECKLNNGKRWTTGEDEFLTENFMEMSDVEMGNILGRTSIAVRTRRNRVGINRYSLIRKNTYGLKECSACKVVKDCSEFYNSASSFDKLEPYCKSCNYKYVLSYRKRSE